MVLTSFNKNSLINSQNSINFALQLRNKSSLTAPHVMTTKYSIFDLKQNDLVYTRHNGAVVQAQILEMVSEVKLPYVEPNNGRVNTKIVLLLATGEKVTIEEYYGGCFPSNNAILLYMSVDDCIKQNHVKSNITLACNFAEKLFNHFGMKYRTYPASQFHGAGIDHVFLYRKDATQVKEIAYDGFVYYHDNFENTQFTTTHYLRALGDPSTAINGTLDYLKDNFRLYPTEKAAYDALKPRVITFADKVATKPIKMRVTQIFEVEISDLAQAQALTQFCPASIIADVEPTAIIANISTDR